MYDNWSISDFQYDIYIYILARFWLPANSSPPKIGHSNFAPKLFVFAAIWSSGRSKIIIKSGDFRLNHQNYIKFILPSLIKDLKQGFKNHRRAILQQDNAPAHRAGPTQQFIAANFTDFISPAQWPAHSPDLNPCDYFLWGYLKERVFARRYTTLSGLRRAIRSEYDSIPQEFITNSINAWRNRLSDCVAFRGDTFE